MSMVNISLTLSLYLAMNNEFYLPFSLPLLVGSGTGTYLFGVIFEDGNHSLTTHLDTKGASVELDMLVWS